MYVCVFSGEECWKEGSQEKIRGANETGNSEELLRTEARLPRRSPDSRAVPAGRGQQLGGRSQPRARGVARLKGTVLLNAGRGIRLIISRSDPAAKANLGLGCESEVCGVRCGGPAPLSREGELRAAPLLDLREERSAVVWRERWSLEGAHATRGWEGFSAPLQLRPGLVPPTPARPRLTHFWGHDPPPPSAKVRLPPMPNRPERGGPALRLRTARGRFALRRRGGRRGRERARARGGGGGADALDRGRERQAAGCM